MMRKWALRLALLLVIAGFVLAASSAVQAQNTAPAACRSEKYDLDADGVLSIEDVTAWGRMSVESGCMVGSSEYAPDKCPVRMDMNADGRVDRADAVFLVDLYLRCFGPQPSTSPGQ